MMGREGGGQLLAWMLVARHSHGAWEEASSELHEQVSSFQARKHTPEAEGGGGGGG